MGGNVVDIGAARARIVGDELRNLLRHTASAMTMRGAEQISNEELVLRLETDGLIDAGDRAAIDDKLARLRLSFFFIPGQRERGGEFVHKTFREYLLAEAVVEAVKQMAVVPHDLAKRGPYWKEFDESDPRSNYVEQLGRLLGPQWLTPDVARHVGWLIAWEIRRAKMDSEDWRERDETQPRNMADWIAIRNGLAGLWDWWAEGVHLRPQPRRERGGQANSFSEPYAVRLSKEIAPTDLPRGVMPEPVRVTTIDAHLGDGLFRLNCTVHFEINRTTGWLDQLTRDSDALYSVVWQDAAGDDAVEYPYQSKIGVGQQTWVAFAPAGRGGQSYFRNYCHRINSAGWRPEGFFPNRVDMSGVDFAGNNLALLLCSGSSFQYARLSKAFFGSVYLTECNLRDCAAAGLQLDEATLSHVDFSGADLREATFRGARVYDTRLEGACVAGLNCANTLFVGVDMSSLSGADTSLATFAQYRFPHLHEQSGANNQRML
jgi:hypothetical protein